MPNIIQIAYVDNPDFNLWLDDNYIIQIEEFTYPSSDVLYKMNYNQYCEALERYNTNPQLVLKRIFEKFPTPIAHYLEQAENNYENPHHRLDLLKSCWESIIYTIYGLVVGEARHKQIPLKLLGLIKWDKFESDKVYDKLLIIENILDYVTSNRLNFECAKIIPISILADIRKLNQERNGFEHAAARNAQQQSQLYDDLLPLVKTVLSQMIGLEGVTLFRHFESEQALYPRCEIFNGNSLAGKKGIIALKRENYLNIFEYFDKKTVFAQIGDEAFCLAPFIHFMQEIHETNPLICFFKKNKGGKYKFEVMSKSQDKDFEKSDFDRFVNEFKALII